MWIYSGHHYAEGNCKEQNIFSENGYWNAINNVYQEPFAELYSHPETLCHF